MKKLTDVEDRIRQVAWPALPEGLRDRMLSQAQVQARSIAWSDRVWFSRRWRLSMAAATIALLAIQVLSGPRGTGSLAPSSRALAEAQALGEASREIGLPAELTVLLARRSLTDARSRLAGAQVWQALQLLNDEGERR